MLSTMPSSTGFQPSPEQLQVLQTALPASLLIRFGKVERALARRFCAVIHYRAR